MKFKTSDYWGIAALLLSVIAVFYAMDNNYPPQPPINSVTDTPKLENPTSLQPVQLDNVQQDMGELRKSIEQTHELLAQLQNRQLKLEKFTKSQVNRSGNSQASNISENTITVSPKDSGLNAEALNRRDQHLTYLEDALYEQELDPVWSLEMSEKINETITSLPGKLLDTSYVQCQSTLCMVELTVNKEEVDKFILGFNEKMVDVSQQMRSFVHKRGDGNLTMQMYMTRAGHELPSYKPETAMP